MLGPGKSILRTALNDGPKHMLCRGLKLRKERHAEGILIGECVFTTRTDRRDSDAVGSGLESQRLEQGDSPALLAQ